MFITIKDLYEKLQNMC